MRAIVVRAALFGLAALLPGCVAAYGPARVDPEEVAERVVIGAALGTALGTGIGTAASINPAIGAVVGAEVGATLGAAAGAMTAQPLPSYTPIPPPAAAVIPGFYDTWPPGYHAPPLAAQTPPPRPG